MEDSKTEDSKPADKSSLQSTRQKRRLDDINFEGTDSFSDSSLGLESSAPDSTLPSVSSILKARLPVSPFKSSSGISNLPQNLNPEKAEQKSPDAESLDSIRGHIHEAVDKSSRTSDPQLKQSELQSLASNRSSESPGTSSVVEKSTDLELKPQASKHLGLSSFVSAKQSILPEPHISPQQKDQLQSLFSNTMTLATYPFSQSLLRLERPEARPDKKQKISIDPPPTFRNRSLGQTVVADNSASQESLSAGSRRLSSTSHGLTSLPDFPSFEFDIGQLTSTYNHDTMVQHITNSMQNLEALLEQFRKDVMARAAKSIDVFIDGCFAHLQSKCTLWNTQLRDMKKNFDEAQKTRELIFRTRNVGTQYLRKNATDEQM